MSKQVAAVLSGGWSAWAFFGLNVLLAALLLRAIRVVWLITFGVVVIGVPVVIAASYWWLVALNLLVLGLLIAPSARSFMQS
jgi:hypothetical protein